MLNPTITGFNFYQIHSLGDPECGQICVDAIVDPSVEVEAGIVPNSHSFIFCVLPEVTESFFGEFVGMRYHEARSAYIAKMECIFGPAQPWGEKMHMVLYTDGVGRHYSN